MSDKFISFYLDDITGWINTRDYPSEIDNKQVLELKNWNFEWNKLVTEKWIEQTTIASSRLSAMAIDSGDIWTVRQWWIYKWGIEQLLWRNVVRISVNENTKFYPITATPWVTPSPEKAPYWLEYPITLEGVVYKIKWTSVSDIITKLYNALVGVYNIYKGNDAIYIYKSNNSPISVNAPSITNFIIYNTIITTEYNKVNWNYSDWTNFISVWQSLIVGVKINWVKYSTRHTVTWSTAASKELNIMNTLLWLIPSQYSPSLVFLNADKTISLWGKQISDWYVAILIQWAETVEEVSTYFNSFWWSSPSYASNLYISGPRWSGLHSIPANPTRAYLMKKVSDVIWYNILEYYGIMYSINDMQNVTLSWDAMGNSSIPLSSNHWQFTMKLDWKKQTWTILEWENIWNTSLPLWRATITLGNQWQLITDLDNWWAVYIYDNKALNIGVESVWTPKLWTIYNWKIILWGYTWNDNIIFSQTSSPTSPLNLLNFKDYSAWWQSISGWDKWEITWFSVWENWLYVFKDNSVWYSNSENDDVNSKSFNLVFRKITSSGALSQNVITDVQQEVFYLDWKTRSVRRLWYEQNLTTLRDTKISGEIQSLLDALPEEQFLATSHFKYPNYTLSLTDGTSNSVTYWNWKTYKMNNKHFIYNVENKSWTTSTGMNYVICSHKWYIWMSDYIFKTEVWNTTQEWDLLSKEYTFYSDVDFKRIKSIEFVWKIQWIWWAKTLDIEILSDWETLEIWEDSFPLKRRITASSWTMLSFRERIDLYSDCQTLQFKLKHSWNGRIEVSDINIFYKPLKVFHSDYY